jgi:hypothetical protein
MIVVRHRIVVCAIALLVCQAAIGAALLAPDGPGRAPAAAEELECTCAHTPGATCPMHHTQQATTDAGGPTSHTRWSAGCPDSNETLLVTALAGPVSVPAHCYELPRPDRAGDVVLVDRPRRRDVDRRPLSPPPRPPAFARSFPN